MNRRRFLCGLTLGTLAAPLAAWAQQAGKVPRVGILSTGTPNDGLRGLESFREELRSAGHVEGKTLTLEPVYGMGRIDRLDHLVAELLSGGATILVTAGPYGSLAAKRATTTVPIVFVGAHSPVELGLVASIARPGGNVTGVAWDVGPEITAKQLEMLKEAVPHLARVTYLYGAVGTPDARAYVAAMEAGARYLGVKLQLVSVTKPEEYDAALRAVSTGRADGLTVAGNARNFVHRKLILDFAAQNRLPVAYGWRQAVEDGGLLSYGPELTHLWRRAAVYVDKILKGAKPADLPVEQPTKFELVINMRTAKALGLTIPPSVLARADEIIQ